MEDLLQSQINNSFMLAIPEGLRDLMFDLSREVLRAQPADLYNFIVNYLEALLLARDTLSVACQVCGDICNCSCQPELDEELRNLGLDGEDLVTAKNLVMEHFDKDEVNEGGLLMKLFQKTNMDVNLLEDIQEAVQAAFLKHQQSKFKAEAEKANKAAQNVVKHTLQIYEQAKVDQKEAEDAAAIKIQASVRGHFVIGVPLDEAALKLKRELTEASSYDATAPTKKAIHKPLLAEPSSSKPVRMHCGRLSSTSLAGSLIHLPQYVPYSVHEETTYEDFEERETEHHSIDYTLEKYDKNKKKQEKKIVFHEQHVLHKIDSCRIEEESNVAEEIAEEILSGSNSVNENSSNDVMFVKDVPEVMYDESEVEEEIEDAVEICEESIDDCIY